MFAREIPVAVPADLPTPALDDALSRVVPNLIIVHWRELAADQVDSGDYLARLTPQEALIYPYAGDPDAVAVVNTALHAAWLEDGRAGFHLASRWGVGGGRWKVGKDGGLYAHVPFRIGTPLTAGGGASSRRARLGATMPKRVYSFARRLQQGDRLAGFGTAYKQSKSYTYFNGAGMDVPQHLVDVGGYTWKASQFEGMFANIQRTAAAPRHAEYMTIRTITPDSPGWFIPPTPAHHYAERALEQAMPQIDEIIAAAAGEDLAAAMNDAIGGVL